MIIDHRDRLLLVTLEAARVEADLFVLGAERRERRDIRPEASRVQRHEKR